MINNHKQNGRNWFPRCRFIISAVHSLTMNGYSPAAFDALPKFPSASLLLNQEESLSFLSNEHYGLHSKFSTYDQLRLLIAKQCAGHIGSLTICVWLLNFHFHADSQPNETEAVKYFLSAEVILLFNRCFGGSTSKHIKPPFITYLQRILLGKHELSESESEIDELMHFVKSGILKYDAAKSATSFASPLAERFFYAKCFPNRCRTMPASLDILVEQAVCFISRQLLESSVPEDLFPKEAVFQHLMLTSLAQCTPPHVSIYPELSHSFATGEPIPGEIDFFLNDELGWGIELLIEGRDVTKHMSRFEPGGKYALLNARDYRIVDFRKSDDGEPTQVFRDDKRITVFFKSGDFSRCTLVLGMEEPREIQLRR